MSKLKSNHRWKTLSNWFSWKYHDNTIFNVMRGILWAGSIIIIEITVGSIEKIKGYSELVSIFSAALEILIGVFQFFSAKIDSLLNRQEIIIKLDIQEFNQNHVKVIQELFYDLEKKDDIREIYVLDNSHFAQWWSGSMLAYLAVQSVWLHDTTRNIHRFFVIDKADIDKTQARKLLTFHILMGFMTYILTKESYCQIIKEYKRTQHKNVDKKEFFIWDGSSVSNDKDDYRNPSYSCEIPSIQKIHQLDKKVIGYQSLWDVDTPYFKRKDGNRFNCLDGKIRDLAKWSVKFEFILPEYENQRNQYLDFAKYLVSQAHTCFISSGVGPGNLIIHIPLFPKAGLIPIDKTTIDGILTSFINK